MISTKLLAVSAIAVVGLLSTQADAHVSVVIGAPVAYVAPPPPPPPVWVTPATYYAPVVHYHPTYVQSGYGWVQQQGPAFYDNCHHHDHRGAVAIYRGRPGPAPRWVSYDRRYDHRRDWNRHDHHDHRDDRRYDNRYDNRGRGNGRGNDRGRGNGNVVHRR